MPYASSSKTLAALTECLPRFASLRRAAWWPEPARRLLVGRWLARRGLTASPGSVVQALKLVQEDDRAFCRAVRLVGWREAAEEHLAVFELEDDSDLGWSVALRALVLFGEARLDRDAPRRVVPPGDGKKPSGSAEVPIFKVRTESLSAESRGAAEFRVIIHRDPTQ